MTEGGCQARNTDCPNFRGTPYNETSLLDKEEQNAYAPESS